VNAAGRSEDDGPNQPQAEENQWASLPADGDDPSGRPPFAPGQPVPAADGQDPGQAPPPAWGSPMPPFDAFNSPAAPPLDAFGAVPPPDYGPAVSPPTTPAAPQEPFSESVPPPSYFYQAAPPEAFSENAAPENHLASPPPVYFDPTAPEQGRTHPTPSNAGRPVPQQAFGPPTASSQYASAHRHWEPPHNEPWVVKTKPQRRFPTALVIIVTGALIVVGGGGYGVFTLVSDRGDADTGGVPTSQVADALFASDPKAPDGFDQGITDVVSTGGTVVATGFEVDGATSRPRFIVSTDQGRTWRTAPITAEDRSAEVAGEPEAVVGTPGGWLALGRAGADWRAWTSTDGRSWAQAKDRLTAFQADDHIAALTRTGQTFVAAGRRGSDEDSSPVVWLSSDGRSWERLDGKRLKLPATTGKPGRLGYLAASGNTLLLTGQLTKAKSNVAAVWRSTDGGRTWTAPEAPSVAGAFGPVHLAAGAGGFFALRESKDGDNRFGAVFRSADGDDWQSAGSVKNADGTPVNPQRIVAGDQGFALLAAGSDDQRALYQSSDGATWQKAADLSQVAGDASRFAVSAGGAVIGGTRRGPDQDFYLAVANGPGSLSEVDLTKVSGAVSPGKSVTDIAAADGRMVAVGGANSRAAVWTSTAGVTWSRADTSALGGSGPQRFTKVVHGPRGWLAIGTRGGHPLAATSLDGRSWQALGDAVFSSGDDVVRLSAAAYGPKGYVVVGTAGSGAKSTGAAWFSADLESWRSAEFPGPAKATTHTMLDVAAGSTGYVAVGVNANSAKSAEQQSRPGVWTSTDGLGWTEKKVDLPAGATTGNLNHVWIKGTTVVAAGDALFDGTRGFAMVSDDLGMTWRAAQLPVPVNGTPTYVTAGSTTSNAFVVVGNLGGRQTDGDVIQWISTDGRSWKVVSPKGIGLSGDGFQRITGLTASGDRLFGVGLTHQLGVEHATLWRVTTP
jgi:hypothetical protein